MEDIIKEITIDRILSIIGIIATVGVAFYIYRIQKNAQKNIEKINNIFNTIAKRRINWFDAHIGRLLRRLKQKCEDLSQKVEAYESMKSQENLTAVVIAGHSITQLSPSSLLYMKEILSLQRTTYQIHIWLGNLLTLFQSWMGNGEK